MAVCKLTAHDLCVPLLPKCAPGEVTEMTQQAAELSPETVLEELKRNGVTHVVWLPDSETNWLYLLMQAEPTLDLITVSREGLGLSLLPQRPG